MPIAEIVGWGVLRKSPSSVAKVRMTRPVFDEMTSMLRVVGEVCAHTTICDGIRGSGGPAIGSPWLPFGGTVVEPSEWTRNTVNAVMSSTADRATPTMR